jgi:pyrimidine deaminase RibD-like protein
MADAAPLPGELAGLDVVVYMSEALVEAEAAGRAGELPIGAVLVVDGVIVSRGRARRRAMRSQLMHAEMQALLHGGDPLWERCQEPRAKASGLAKGLVQCKS